MGVEIAMLANPKYKGIPFHTLSEEDMKKCENEISAEDSIKTLLDTVITENQCQYIKEITTLIPELSSEELCYCYIDTHNQSSVLEKIREKIDELLLYSKRYHPSTYGDHSDLHFWSTFYTAIQNFSEAFDVNKKYILIILT